MKAAEWGRCLPPSQMPIKCNWGGASGEIYSQMGHGHPGGASSAQQNASPGQSPQIHLKGTPPVGGSLAPCEGSTLRHAHTLLMTGGAQGPLCGKSRKERDRSGLLRGESLQSAFLWIRRDEARSWQHPLRDGEHLLSASYMSQRCPGNRGADVGKRRDL